MIELACIADGVYVRHTAALLHSALACSPPENFSVHLLHTAAISVEDEGRLRQVTDKFAARLQLLHIQPATVADLPEGYFPRSVWLRILLPELLPQLDKILYLDSDMIVRDGLQPLWETDVSGHLLAAVTNPFYPFMPPYPRQSLGIARPEDYFNSGVLLMNLALMRSENTVVRLREYARSRPGNSYPDQDALNVVCRGRWLPLHPRWNVQSTLYELKARELPMHPDQLREARSRPAVIHYIGPFKPWQYLCRHPLQGLYFEHARETPWGEPPLEGRSLGNFFLRQLPLAWIDRWMKLERRTAGLWRRAQVRMGRA